MMSRPVPDEGGGKPSPRAAVLWPTGLPGAGKSSIAQAVRRRRCAAEQAAARLVARLA
jgi:adenylylsulfate kinase-like enzyme